MGLFLASIGVQKNPNPIKSLRRNEIIRSLCGIFFCFFRDVLMNWRQNIGSQEHSIKLRGMRRKISNNRDDSNWEDDKVCFSTMCMLSKVESSSVLVKMIVEHGWGCE